MAISTRINDPWIEGRYGLGQIFAAQCARNVTGVSPSTTPTLRTTATPIPLSGTNRSQSTLTVVRKKCGQTAGQRCVRAVGTRGRAGDGAGLRFYMRYPRTRACCERGAQDRPLDTDSRVRFPTHCVNHGLAHDRLAGSWGMGGRSGARLEGAQRKLTIFYLCPEYATVSQRRRSCPVSFEDGEVHGVWSMIRFFLR